MLWGTAGRMGCLSAGVTRIRSGDHARPAQWSKGLGAGAARSPAREQEGESGGEEGQIPGPLGLQPEVNFILVPEKPGGVLGSSRERAGLL